MQNEKKKQNESEENRATTPTTNSQIAEIKPIHSNCKVCSSGFVDIIHKLRATMTLDELSEVLKKEHGLELSKTNLSYHFVRYGRALENESAKKLYEKFKSDVDAIADHQHKTLFLANISFKHIMDRLDAGSLVLGIDDFEKLVKLYHSVLKNPHEAGDNNIIAIFQRASEKYGCSLEQGVLVKMPRANEPHS